METAKQRVLIPMQLDESPPPRLFASDDDSATDDVSAALIEALEPSQIVLLGYWPVPDQSSPKQLREQFEDEASERLERIRHSLKEQAFEIPTELSFTKDRDHLIDRVANKHGCESVLHPGAVRSTPPESALVLLKSHSDLDRIARVLSELFADSTTTIVLFHAVERGDDTVGPESLLRAVADRLTEQGIPGDQIHREQSGRGSRNDAIVSAATDHDLIVLGESKPSVRERIFGPVQSAITDRTDRPPLTVRANT